MRRSRSVLRPRGEGPSQRRATSDAAVDRIDGLHSAEDWQKLLELDRNGPRSTSPMEASWRRSFSRTATHASRMEQRA